MIKGFVVIALSIAATIGLLRYNPTWIIPDYKPKSKIVQEAVPVAYVQDLDVGVKLKPYTKIHFASPPYYDNEVITNSEGFVDREHYLKTDLFRIAILGDSAVEAYGVSNANRFPAVIEQEVDIQSQGKKQVEVMSFGVSGWGTVHEYGAIKKYVLKYKPNEVWLMFLPVNDMGDNTPLFNGPPSGPIFEYTDHTKTELRDIHFGYQFSPTQSAQRNSGKYDESVNKKIFEGWMTRYFPFFYSKEHDPTWDEITSHTMFTFKLIKKTLDPLGIKLRVIYRVNGYEDETSPGDFGALRTAANKALGRDIQMSQSYGFEKTKKALNDMGIDVISLKGIKNVVSSQENEWENEKHRNLGKHLASFALKNCPINQRF